MKLLLYGIIFILKRGLFFQGSEIEKLKPILLETIYPN